MFSMTYVSSAKPLLSDKDIEEILASSRTNNQRDGISGILLYAEGNIIQVLEGEEDKVYDTYHRIEKDPRHSGPMILLREQITERAFPEWSMGFKSIPTGLVEECGLNQYFASENDLPPINRRKVEILLSNFKNITAN